MQNASLAALAPQPKDAEVARVCVCGFKSGIKFNPAKETQYPPGLNTIPTGDNLVNGSVKQPQDMPHPKYKATL